MMMSRRYLRRRRSVRMDGAAPPGKVRPVERGTRSAMAAAAAATRKAELPQMIILRSVATIAWPVTSEPIMKAAEPAPPGAWQPCDARFIRDDPLEGGRDISAYRERVVV
jgi:hypothetical protein